LLTGLQNYRINSQLRTGCKKLVFFLQRPEIIIFSANGNATTVVASKDFAPYYQLGEMIHPNLVIRNSHSSFDILFSLPPPQMCTQPN